MSENILKRIVSRRQHVGDAISGDAAVSCERAPVNEEVSSERATISEQQPNDEPQQPEVNVSRERALPPFVAVLLKQFGITPEAIQAYAEGMRVAITGALQRIEDRCNTIDKRLETLERAAHQTEMTDGAVRDVDLKEGQFMG